MSQRVLLCALWVIVGCGVVAPAQARLEPRSEQLAFAPTDVSLNAVDGGHRVHLSGGVLVGEEPLPRFVHWVELAPGTRAVAVDCRVLGTTEVAMGVDLVSPGPDRRPGIGGPAPVPQLGAARAVLGTFGFMRGHPMQAVILTPLDYDPHTGRLSLATALELTVEVAPAPGVLPLERRRIVPSIESRFEKHLAPKVSHFASQLRGGAVAPAGDGPFQPTHRPSTDGSPVEYVIVTGAALEAEFQRLADWKTQKGVQATVRTVEWIDQTYPNGVDGAERVRFFLQDAYQNWGTRWVLLGGDTDVVPHRSPYFALLDTDFIPSDYYYGCLEGNWNADGDALWGEGWSVVAPGDSADLLPELTVGRAPVSTVSEAQAVVDKILAYDQSPTDLRSYPASLLALVERLFDHQHGSDFSEPAIDKLPPWWRVTRLYEESASYPGSIELNRMSAVDSINAGYGVVLHVGHGFRNTMAIGDESLDNADADNLTNDPLQSVVFAINCSSAAIDFNSIGERWVKNPNGGSVAYIGTSRLAFVNASDDFSEAWFCATFEDSVQALGESVDLARLPLVGLAGQDTAWRWNLLATLLLGDPQTELHLRFPAPLAGAHAGTFQLGQSSYAVQATTQGGTPVAGVQASLWLDGQVLGTAETDAGGNATIPFHADQVGSALLTLHKVGYTALEANVPVVSPSGVALTALAVAVDDNQSGASTGDGDGTPDAGEVLELALTAKNGGSQTATNVVVQLTVDDPAGVITLIDDTVPYGTLGAGAQSTGTGKFVVAIDDAAPVAYQPVFSVSLAADQGSFADTFVLNVHRPYLEHYAHVIDDVAGGDGDGVIEAGERVDYAVQLRNSGQDAALAVAGSLEVLSAASGLPHPDVTVHDATTQFGTVQVGGPVEGDPFDFELAGSVDVADVLLKITWTDQYGTVRTEELDIVPPAVATALTGFGTPTSITLEWLAPADDDIKGYDIYRAPDAQATLQRINAFTVDGTARFEDAGLESLTRYYYSVVVRDDSFNESRLASRIEATTNPPVALGWPQALGNQSESSINFGDLDAQGSVEYVTGSDCMYVWHADGTELVDGDDDERTNGVFSARGCHPLKGFGATAAIGDLDGDLDLEVANVGWTLDSLYVFTHAGRAQQHPGFPKPILDDFNWASPVMADLDGDGQLEILVWAAGGGRLFAWHADGTEVHDGDQNPSTDGVLFRVFGTSFAYSSPAVANLLGDDDLEIVVAVNLSSDDSGKIFLIQADGTVAPGWPVATGGPGTPSQVTASPAIADIDGNGTPEIIIAADRAGGRVYVLRPDGSNKPGWPRSCSVSSGAGRSASPVPVDLDGNGQFEIVMPGSDGKLYGWFVNGATLPNFPVVFSEQGVPTQTAPSVGDIDGDGDFEILFGDESGKVHAYHDDGTQVDGFPIQLPGEVRTTPAIWDFDNDGLVEIAVTGWDSQVHVWDMPGVFDPTRMPWPVFRHDSRNTGWVKSGILPIGVTDPGPAASAPQRARLYPPRPNPFNPRTALAFDVPHGGTLAAELSIFDLNGRLVRVLHQGALPAGRHEYVWDGRDARGTALVAGVYFFQLNMDAFSHRGKLVMVK